MSVAVLICRWVLSLAAFAVCGRLFAINARRARTGQDRFFLTPLYFIALIVGIAALLILPLGQIEHRSFIALVFVLPETSWILAFFFGSSAWK